MMAGTREEQKKEAFRLYEEGSYHESLQLCTLLLETEKDPAIEILLATNLFSTGRLEDAEASFRDLGGKMPESSYVHSYLAKVLEARGDESAIAEFATAVHLDPNNQDALRSYADYLLSRRDYRGAVPLLRRLVSLCSREGDARNFVRALTGAREPAEALAVCRTFAGELAGSPEYLDALFLAGEFREAGAEALGAFRRSGDPALLRRHLAALAKSDVPTALEAYVQHSAGDTDSGILSDYVLFLSVTGNYRDALPACNRLISLTGDTVYRHLACELSAACGDIRPALAAYEDLIREELKGKNDLDLLARILRDYRRLLEKTCPREEASLRFLALVSNDATTPCLIETARMHEDHGNMAEARSSFYRAYRSDFLTGGLPYARFLAVSGDARECEKVLLYILANVKRSQDLQRVAAVIVDPTLPMRQMRRLTDQLIRRLDARRMSLNTEGLELLSATLLNAARLSREDGDYAGCKRSCLRGIDVIPAHATAVTPTDFLSLIRECKEQSIAERPVLDLPPVPQRERRIPVIQQIRDELDLDDTEQKIVEFIRSHKRATEMELRKALGTRRAGGLVNRLIQKAAAKKVTIIGKKGVGEDGEVYEYAGD